MTDFTLGNAANHREAQKQDRRKLIVDAATRVFIRNGYAGTTMSAVFNEIGGSRSTLYGHFPSKEALFEAVLRQALLRYKQDFKEVLNVSGDLRQVLLEFCRHFIWAVASREGIELQHLIGDAVRHFSHVGSLFYDEGPRSTHRLLMRFLRHHQKQGRLSCSSVSRAATTLTGLCIGGLALRALWAVEEVHDQSVDREAGAVVRTFLEAYGPREAAAGSRVRP